MGSKFDSFVLASFASVAVLGCVKPGYVPAHERPVAANMPDNGTAELDGKFAEAVVSWATEHKVTVKRVFSSASDWEEFKGESESKDGDVVVARRSTRYRMISGVVFFEEKPGICHSSHCSFQQDFDFDTGTWSDKDDVDCNNDSYGREWQLTPCDTIDALPEQRPGAVAKAQDSDEGDNKQPEPEAAEDDEQEDEEAMTKAETKKKAKKKAKKSKKK